MDWVADILEDIDAERLRPRTHAVARRLVELEGCDDPLAAPILAAFDAGEATPNQVLLEKLWARISDLEPPLQGALRTLVALLQPDAPIDSYYADYLIGWAQDEGIQPPLINLAFRGTT